jgi:hypothetical protein
MSVFTIYCHGSGGHRDKPDKEIVSFMGRRAVGEEYRDYLILDGVGGKPSGKNNPNPMAGTFNWASRGKEAKGKTPLELGGGRTKGATAANISGHGVEDNARHALVVLGDLPTLPTTVNMVGWSRGAVTTLVIANMLWDIFSQVRVNIFAFDPVAGQDAGRGESESALSRRKIPPSVTNYVGLLATGENRKTFSPQDLSRVIIQNPPSSNVLFLPFPGKHSTAPQNNDPKAMDVTNIAWDAGAPLLPADGHRAGRVPHAAVQRRDAGVLLPDPEPGDVYGGIKQKGLKQRLIGKGFGARDMTQHLEQYTKHSDYFVNEHHRTLFKRALPRMYEWLFTQRAGRAGLEHTIVPASHGVAQDYMTIMANPEMVASLEPLGVYREGPGLRLPGPGAHHDARARADTQATGSLQTAGLL